MEREGREVSEEEGLGMKGGWGGVDEGRGKRRQGSVDLLVRDRQA